MVKIEPPLGERSDDCGTATVIVDEVPDFLPMDIYLAPQLVDIGLRLGQVRIHVGFRDQIAGKRGDVSDAKRGQRTDRLMVDGGQQIDVVGNVLNFLQGYVIVDVATL